MTPQQMNFVTRLILLSDQLNTIADESERMIAEWFLNSHNSITDLQLSEVADFSHITAAELLSTVASLQALQSYFGDKQSGNLANFVKMRG